MRPLASGFCYQYLKHGCYVLLTESCFPGSLNLIHKWMQGVRVCANLFDFGN